MRLFALGLIASAMILVSPDAQDWMLDDLPTSGWLGLYAHQLKPVRVRLKEKQHIEVTPPKPELILRDIPRLAAGPVTEAKYEPGLIEDGKPVAIRHGGETFELRLAANNRVTLHHRAETQVLFPAPEFVDEPHFALVWAGDLDRDGRLDLITVLSPKYSWFPYEVWLSSAAVKGEIVHRIAHYDRYGC